MMHAIEQRRLQVSARTERYKKSELGQFMTPARTATFMASLFPQSSFKKCRLLDPGAGIGSLSGAFLERWVSGGFNFSSLDLTAFEIDERLQPELEKTISYYKIKCQINEKDLQFKDFIEEAVNRIQFRFGLGFTHAILNPPYKKIGGISRPRHLLRAAGIETVNLYSAFVALSLELMTEGGFLVAIIPRSFCNGPYYAKFREFILERSAIRRLHLFGSRNKAFRDDGVLQENIIVMLERGGTPEQITISTSTDDSFKDLTIHLHPFNEIIHHDKGHLIHVPVLENGAEKISPIARFSLKDLGIMVSTGPVVDFRLEKHIYKVPGPGTVPLLYPGHFNGFSVVWPKIWAKKPNAISRNIDTEKWLYPNGFYCVVRRFSSKEERRRILASVVKPFKDVEAIGFENHLNVFHENKRGLPETLARGLAVFLNTTAVDEHFRRFSGHTQVNANDLRLIKYPSREDLVALGAWTIKQKEITQEMIDKLFKELAV